KECLNYVRAGDQLMVTRIDRLARSTLHLCQIAEPLKQKGVDLVVLDQNIDTSDATGRLLFNMLGAIGQFETEIRAERQMDGIKKAKDRGVRFGKRPALSQDQIAELREKRAAGTLIKDLMAQYSLSKATI
ncbi:resolvase, partial [Pseudomonas fluorescens]